MKKILFISLITGLFLAFTACGPKEDEDKDDKDDNDGGEVREETETGGKPSFVVVNTLRSVVTVKSACGSTTVHNKGEASKGRCVAVLNEQATDLEISVQWSSAEGAAPVVLCGPGEGNEACKLQNQAVDFTQDADGNNAPVLGDTIYNGCSIVHCQEEEAAEEAEEEQQDEQQQGAPQE